MVFSIGAIGEAIIKTVIYVANAIIPTLIPTGLIPKRTLPLYAMMTRMEPEDLSINLLDYELDYSDEEAEQPVTQIIEPQEEIPLYHNTHAKLLFAHAKALIAAAQSGDTATAIELIASGAPVNALDSTGNSPLKAAIESNNAELICALIQAGAYIPENKFKAKPNNTKPMTHPAVRINFDFITPQRETWMDEALIAAVQFKNTLALKALIEANADVNAIRSNGDTALMIAVYNEDFRSVDILIKAGADLEARNASGKTALTLISSQPVQKSTQLDIIFRLLSASSEQGNMPFIYKNPLNSLVWLHKHKIMQIRSEVLGIVGALGIINIKQPVLPRVLMNKVLSHPSLYPRWYESHIQKDMRTICNIVNKIVQKRQQKMLLLANKPVKAPKRKEPEGFFSSENQVTHAIKKRRHA